MRKTYRVNFNIFGSVLVEAETESEAEEMVEQGVNNFDPDIMKLVRDATNQHLDYGDIDVGEATECDGFDDDNDIN